MFCGFNRMSEGVHRHHEGREMRMDNCHCPTEDVTRECFVKTTRVTTDFQPVSECGRDGRGCN